VRAHISRSAERRRTAASTEEDVVTPPHVLQMTSRMVRVLHVALFAGAMAMTTLLSALGPDTGAGPDLPPNVLRYLTLGVLVVDLIVARAFRARLPPFVAGGDEAAYWRDHLRGAIIVWALVESAVLFAAVMHFLSGDWVTLGAAAVALAVLWGYRPGRLIVT
jgi:hypothetical protein